jgi:hypothetical protein
MTNKPALSSSDKDLDPGFRSRRVSRVVAGGTASLTPQNLYKVEIKVHNLSPCGFMAECAEPIRIGSYVSLDVPGIGPVHAQIRWQIGARMGGMFLDPISLSRCEWTAIRTDEAA